MIRSKGMGKNGQISYDYDKGGDDAESWLACEMSLNELPPIHGHRPNVICTFYFHGMVQKTKSSSTNLLKW